MRLILMGGRGLPYKALLEGVIASGYKPSVILSNTTAKGERSVTAFAKTDSST